MLDASFLNLAFLRRGMSSSEVAIGNNLLIYDWITDLVRLNKSFIVKRNTSFREGLLAAKHLSAYIHFTILDKHESIWIAQREGRAKDSSDHTQESLVKMLALGGQGPFMEKIKEINLMPVAISYEYDPNDYLKAKEFLLRRRDPDFKKSQRDDLFSMETGLLQFKGKVHFQLTPRINARIDQIGDFRDVNTAAKYVCLLIDQAIHRSYEIFVINYVAYDMLNGGNRFARKYTDAERDRVLAEGKAAGRQLPKGEGIQRYKGLGEMSYQELWETTMDPEHRILKQVQIEDAAAADETFSMLMGDEVEPRRLFIQRNARNVSWIDA